MFFSIYIKPLWVICIYIALLVITFAIGNYLFRKKLSLFWKISNMVMFVVAFSAVIYLTLLNRTSNESQLILIPLYSFFEARQQPEAYRVLLMNVFLFVPIGLTMPNILPKRCKKHVAITVIFGCLFSVMLELVQYMFVLGRCEIDDVLANTLGVFIGCLAFMISKKLIAVCDSKKREKMQETQKGMDTISNLLLSIISHELFNGEMPDICEENITALLKEASAQSVFPMVYAALKRDFGNKYPEKINKYEQLYLTYVVSCVQNAHEYNELDTIMNKCKIPYCVLKGFASASYYKDSVLRAVGDVDFIVRPQDVDNASKTLEEYGFVKNSNDSEDIHIVFKRGGFSIWELHHNINGIPDSDIGVRLNDDIKRVIDDSRRCDNREVNCNIPSEYHHGLIMMLHIISHLTSEGIGLRHICDWAVFVDSFNEDEFEEMFRGKFTQYGIWKFAQIITMACVEYLGLKPQKWAKEIVDNNVFTQQDMEELMLDVISGGNFGQKDRNRSREIKYISDKSGTVDDKNLFLQVFHALNSKVYDNYSFIRKYKIFLPVGWCVETVKYIALLISGKRKSTDNIFMLKEATKRKKLYSKLELFKG